MIIKSKNKIGKITNSSSPTESTNNNNFNNFIL